MKSMEAKLPSSAASFSFSSSSSFSVLLLPVLVVVTLVAWKLLNSLWLRPRKLEKCLRDQGFQGNPYRSINGDLVQMGQMTRSALSKPISFLSHDIIPRIMPFVHQVVSQYGMKSFIWYGKTPRVNITEPDMIREIFTKWNTYEKLHPGGRRKSNFGIATREGENWRAVRRVLKPAFDIDKLKCMLPVMELSCEAMVNKWEEIVAPEGSAEIDVWPSLTKLTSDVISQTAFGSCYESGNRIFDLLSELIMLVYQGPSNYLPGWRFLPNKINKRKEQLNQEICGIIKSLIDKRKESMKTGSSQYGNDLLGIMLESNEQEIKEYGSGMTTDDVIQECRLFYLAGQESTASLLTWAMILLSQHQEWQTKAREEVMRHFGKDKTPDLEGLNQLKIVAMILNETLRFYPPVASLSRMIHQDVNLKHLHLLNKTELCLPVILVHRDTQLWGDDANEFNPGRFEGGVCNAAKVPGSFFPFGSGPRVCLGQNFALVEAKLALAKILQRFYFDISPSYVHAPQYYALTVPQFGAPLILHKI